MTDGFRPRADTIDGAFFVETAGSLAASTTLWGLLRVSRGSSTGSPVVVLCGPGGVGTSTVARRFCRAAWRQAACEILAKMIGEPVSEPPERGTAWAEGMAIRHGATLDMAALARASLQTWVARA